MKIYDTVVIGGGDVGLAIVFSALAEKEKVALVEKGHFGGTCVNVGCVPSKTLIATADRIMEIREADRFGISAEVKAIDFGAVMGRMKDAVLFGRNSIEEGLRNSEGLDLYKTQGRFVSDYTLQVGEETIRGKKVFIASGTRPFIPPIKGLEDSGYLTNESLLELREKPESLIIAGGGYIGVEYAHFFEAAGTKVTMVERNSGLVMNEEPEISELLRKKLGERLSIHLDTEMTEVKRGSDGGCLVRIRSLSTGEEKEIGAEKLLIATGRKPNADLLDPGKTGVETDRSGFIRANNRLETSRENIWALGDAIGRQMFTHAGDKEAEIAWHNSKGLDKKEMDFGSVPHAVFTWPQIASVGLTEARAAKDFQIITGKAKYSDTVKGTALMEEETFAKAVLEKGTGKILGFHIIGPHADILLQEVVNTVVHKDRANYISGSMHVFPSLSDLITEALGSAGS